VKCYQIRKNIHKVNTSELMKTDFKRSLLVFVRILKQSSYQISFPLVMYDEKAIKRKVFLKVIITFSQSAI